MNIYFLLAANFALFTPCGAFAALLTNDLCTNAIPISDSMLPLFDTKNSSLATNSISDPILSCTLTFDGEKATDGNTFWYRYMSSSDGVLIVDISESIAAAVVGMYMGNDCKNLQEVICSEEETIMYYQVSKNRTYYIKVGEYSDGLFGSDMISIKFSKERNFFTVIDANTDRTYSLLYDLFNGGYSFDTQNTIDYSKIPTSSLSIEAKFNNVTSTVRSVRLTIDKQPTSICQASAPYTLFGNLKGNILGSPLVRGSRTVTATAFNEASCRGRVVGQMSQQFVVRGCADGYFSLYDADTNKFKQTISNGTIITSLPCSANIEYTFDCGFKPKTVTFELRSVVGNILVALGNEKLAPYFLFRSNDTVVDAVPKGSIVPGEYTITASIDGIVQAPVQFTVNGICAIQQPIDNSFSIDVRFAGNESPLTTPFTYDEAKLFVPIIKRVSSLIIGDKPDILNTTDLGSEYFCGAYPPLIDDLFVCTGLFEYNNDNDEILGVMIGGYSRESDNLPFTSTVLLDRNNFYKMKAAGTAGDYILQHLIQTLGGYEVWSAKGLADRVAPCSYKGKKAKAEFQKITSCTANIPLEQNSLPFAPEYNEFDCLFWDPNCLKNEVLTFTIGKKKISRITLGSLEDIGYKVNYTNADPYTMNDIGVCSGCKKRREMVEVSPPIPSCHEGPAFEKAIVQGQKMLKTMYDHYSGRKLPPGVVYSGNQPAIVAFQHESGMMCSVIVTRDGSVL